MLLTRTITLAKQERLDKAYMRAAFGYAYDLSHARRNKVGAVLVAPNGGGQIAEGINGTPTGFDNNCEDEIVVCEHDWEHYVTLALYVCSQCGDGQDDCIFLDNLPKKQTKLVTKRECLHAETNAIAKVARSTQSTIGATLYSTLSPCYECAKLIIQCGIVRVVCAEIYRIPDGIELLRKARIRVDIIAFDGHNVGSHENQMV